MIKAIYEEIWHNQYLYDLSIHVTNCFDSIEVIMIGDVLERVFEQEDVTQSEWYTIAYQIISEREEMREAIEDQSDECIEYIYWLLPWND